MWKPLALKVVQGSSGLNELHEQSIAATGAMRSACSLTAIESEQLSGNQLTSLTEQ